MIKTLKRIIPLKLKNFIKYSLKKFFMLPVWIVEKIINITKIDSVCSCEFSYVYESKRLYDNAPNNENVFSKYIYFKNILGYSIIPKEYFIALEVDRVNYSFSLRNQFLYDSKELLCSEIIKYAHALDKGLRMPNKRKVFGRQKSEVLEVLLIRWAKNFDTSNPIYIWAKNLLFEYWEDQELLANKSLNFRKKVGDDIA
ncbi:hypothetical protein [Bacillus alveayuensis]|uniref:hypothetical protein n=1 Tax=Aeribacillus alveayuensis TaxID=279215 RepID=UPI0005CCBFD7|nr:hypothetical protein [Bacillus alveayuensis]